MGRQKRGKPRRERPGGGSAPGRFLLRELEPPGDAYRRWYEPAGLEAAAATTGGAVRLPGQRLSEDAREARDLAERIRRLGPVYGGHVPHAALLLDMAVDAGAVTIQRPGEAPLAVPVAAIVAGQQGQTPDGARRALHDLHAAGAFLITTEQAGPGGPRTAVVRFVAKRPAAPGEAWALAGDGPVAEPSLCLPAAMSRDLDPATVSAVIYLRSKQARLEDPDPAEYAVLTGLDVPDVEDVFAGARDSGLVDYRGCEACPAGHLCTRKT